MTEIISGVIAILVYLTCATLLYRLKDLRHVSRLRWMGLAAYLFHTLALFNTVFTTEGLNMSFFYAISLIGWMATLLLLLGGFSKPLDKLGIAVYPMAALALTTQLIFPGLSIIAPAGDWKMQVHILFSLFASSTLFLASLQAILLHVQDSHLHHKHPGGFIKTLPPLQAMERLLFELITLGFLLLTVALVSGYLFIEDMFSPGHAHKTVLSHFAWVLFGILLLGRWRAGWRGRTAITLTLASFAVLILGYLGSKFVLEIILHRT